VFSLSNRAKYFPAVGSALSAVFGQSTQVSIPRQMEVAVRFSF